MEYSKLQQLSNTANLARSAAVLEDRIASFSERIPTGIDQLDLLLRGGIPQRTLNIVIGKPGSGKSIFGKQFLCKNLAQDRNGILIDTFETLDSAKATIICELCRQRISEKMLFLDCYSWKNGCPTSSSLACHTNLGLDIGSLFKKAENLPGNSPAMVFDSFSDYIVWSNSTNESIRFLDTLRAKLASIHATSLIMLEEGVHDEKLLAALEFIADGTVRIKNSEYGQFLKVHRMPRTQLPSKWVPFTITQRPAVRS
ncbi:MAG: RAD55 family ATPase [Candidatus Bathyarchaeia archaeon]